MQPIERTVLAVGRLGPGYEHLRVLDVGDHNRILRRRVMAAVFQGDRAMLSRTDSGVLECVIHNAPAG